MIQSIILPSPRDEAGALEQLANLADHARDHAKRSGAANARRAYTADWRIFQQWCANRGLAALPAAPETVALYLADEALRRRVSTLQRRLSAIRQAHRAANMPFDASRDALLAVWGGIRRTHGTAPRRKAPVLTPMLRAMSHALPSTLLGARDRALLVLGFAGAFCRGELAGLDIGDLQFTSDGLVVAVRRSWNARRRPPGSTRHGSPDTASVPAWRRARRRPVSPSASSWSKRGTRGPTRYASTSAPAHSSARTPQPPWARSLRCSLRLQRRTWVHVHRPSHGHP